MASLRPRPSRREGVEPSIAVLLRVPKEHGPGKRQTSVTFDPPDAEKAAGAFMKLCARLGDTAAYRVFVATGTSSAAATMPTVTELVRDHIDNLHGVELGTKRDYLSYVRLNLEGALLGSLPVDVVTRDHVGDWIDDLAADGYAYKSIKNRQGLLSGAFERAVAKKLRGDNPAKKQKIPKTEVEEKVFLTHDEFAVLLGKFDPAWWPLIATLAGTGLRWSEATALQVRDLHLDDRTPTLTVVRAWKHTDKTSEKRLGPPKTERGRRSVSLSPSLVDLLRPLAKGRKAADFVLTNRQGNPILHTSWYKRVWQVGVELAVAEKDVYGKAIPPGLRLTKKPRIHDLRHTHASWLIADGTPLTEIQYRLGHESIQTTSDLYGHLLPGHHERAASSIEAAMSQALPDAPEEDTPPAIEEADPTGTDVVEGTIVEDD